MAEKKKRKKRYRRKQNSTGKVWISVIVMTLLLVMSVQIARLQDKDQAYAEQEANLESQLKSEQDRSEDIKDYEEYTKTDQFVEDMAKSKLGLVYKDEILFKKK